MKRYILPLLFFYQSQAFAYTEAFSFFNPQEFATINRPELIDGEYYSDQLAYRHSLINDYSFLKSKNAFDFYVGSISSKQFGSEKRLKLAQEITPSIQFDLVYIEKENFEEARQQFITGLTFKISDLVSFSPYTSLVYDKDKNDIGAAVNLKLSHEHTLRAFINLVDFGFNERNELNAKDIKSPLNYGFIGTVLTETFQFVEYYAFRNNPMIRDFIDDDKRYIFEETRFGFRGRKALNQFNFINFDIEFFQREEGDFGLTTPDPVNDERWKSQGYRLLGQWQKNNFILGVEHNHRKWSSDSVEVRHNNWMPHIWYGWRWNSKVYIPSGLDLGLEGSFHKANGPTTVRSKSDEDKAFNGRMNIRAYYAFSETARLNLLFSLDLDDMSWEGGGGQFQILF